jgi:hypothetical protein
LIIVVVVVEPVALEEMHILTETDVVLVVLV